jgi:ABC-type phosphate transport system auxiliary subunit
MTARLVSNEALETPAVFAHGRIVVLGQDSQRLHEEVIVAGGRLREGRFARLGVGETADALRAALPQAVPEALQADLLAQWPKLLQPLSAALEARMRERTANLKTQLQEKAEQEINTVRTVLQELARSIQAQLEGPLQLTLDFSDEERGQVQRDHEALAVRLTQLPAEIERETQAIRDRYAAPVPRLFPVAVTFLVPERLAR